MAEIFYNLKQTYVSMSYAIQALETYQSYETYTVRRIQCEFVIAGNYDDMQYPERALPHLELALDLAKKKAAPVSLVRPYTILETVTKKWATSTRQLDTLRNPYPFASQKSSTIFRILSTH